MNIQSFVAAMFTLGNKRGPSPKEVSPQTAWQQAKDGNVLIVDVRRPEEWAETGTAPGAARITLQDTDFLQQLDAATGGDKDTALAFICRSGQRSGSAAEQAASAGYTNAYNVTGGMSMAGGWIDAGLPVERI
jgi:rhodanese-related sulfurtransferase